MNLQAEKHRGYAGSEIPNLCLRVQGSGEHVNIETAGERQHLPHFLRAAHALQMPAPPLALLLHEEIGKAPFARRLRSTTGTLWWSLAFRFPLLGISLLQCKLVLGPLVLLSSPFYQFPALFFRENVAKVVDVLAPQKRMAKPQGRENASGCPFLRREGVLIV